LFLANGKLTTLNAKRSQTNRDTATVIASNVYAQKNGTINKLKTLHETGTYLRIKELPHYLRRHLLGDRSFPNKTRRTRTHKKNSQHWRYSFRFIRVQFHPVKLTLYIDLKN